MFHIMRQYNGNFLNDSERVNLEYENNPQVGATAEHSPH